jgi:hypothetical protein
MENLLLRINKDTDMLTKKISLISVALCVFLISTFTAEKSPDYAYLSAVRGTVYVTKADKDKKMKARPGMKMKKGDEVRTMAGSMTVVSYPNGSKSIVRERSLFTFDGLKADKKDFKVNINMKTGSIRSTISKLGKNHGFILQTPNVVAGVRGTDFEVNDKGVRVYKGKVEVKDKKTGKKLAVGEGQKAEVSESGGIEQKEITKEEQKEAAQEEKKVAQEEKKAEKAVEKQIEQNEKEEKQDAGSGDSGKPGDTNAVVSQSNAEPAKSDADPTISIALTESAPYKVNVTSQAGNTLEIKVNGTTVVQEELSSDSASFDISDAVALEEGETSKQFTVTAQVKGPTGNSSTATAKLTINKLCPEAFVNLLLPITLPNLQGVTESGSTIKIAVNGSTVIEEELSTGTFKFNIESELNEDPYGETPNSIQVDVNNSCGNSASASATVIYDKTKPVIDISAEVDGDIVYFEGSIGEAGTLTVNGNVISLDSKYSISV